MVAASQQFLINQEDTPTMDKALLAALCALFNTPNATEAEISQKITALAQSKGESQVALSEVYIKLAEKEQSVAALTAQIANPDPAKFVPVEQVAALTAEFNQFKQGIEQDKKAELITAALSAGKLPPALKEWAESLNLAALTDYLAKAPAIAALSGEKQAKADPNENKVAALSAEDKAVAKMLGLSEAEYRKNLETGA